MRLPIAVCLLAATLSLQAQWTQFRGPDGSSLSKEAGSLPAALDASRLQWKTGIPFGLSSPCIAGGRIFLTGIQGTTLQTFCLDAATGEQLWAQEAWYEFIERVHRSNSPATPTVSSDGERVFVYLGSTGLICYDFNGEEVWNRMVRIPPNLYGTASSPIVADGKLIFCNDTQRGSYLEAIDVLTGETLWRTERKDLQYNWTTPMVWDNQGVAEIVVNGQSKMVAYALEDGSKRWELPGLTDEPIVTPVVSNGLIFISSYNMKTNSEVLGPPAWPDLLKILDKDGNGTISLKEARANKSILSRADADGEGDHPLWGFHRRLDQDHNGELIESEYQGLLDWIDSFPQKNAVLAVRPPADTLGMPEIVWSHEKGVPECPSPLVLDGRVYLVKNGGMLSCLDAGSGEVIYRKKLGSGGPYYASPVAGDGKIYLASCRGVISVVEAGPTFKLLSQTDLGERISATPALVGNRVYVRTDNHMMAF